MKGNGSTSIIWILFLLVAMFLGPTMIINKMDVPASNDTLRPGDTLELRALIEQERLIDAPAALPAADVEKVESLDSPPPPSVY